MVQASMDGMKHERSQQKKKSHPERKMEAAKARYKHRSARRNAESSSNGVPRRTGIPREIAIAAARENG